MSTAVMPSNDLSTMDLLSVVKNRNPEQPEFFQAVEEVYYSLQSVLKKKPHYTKLKILDRIVEPERLVSFRVPWPTSVPTSTRRLARSIASSETWVCSSAGRSKVE